VWTRIHPLLAAAPRQAEREVSADHVEAGRFRHGSRLLRWRDDMKPEACRMEQTRKPTST
jgi:hypothetical protein